MQVTLTFLLGGPPYNYSTSAHSIAPVLMCSPIHAHRLVIGLFGLVGMFGVAMAPFVGRLVDNFVPWFTTLLGILGLLMLQAIETGAGGVSIGAVIVVGFGIDVFRQMQQVSLATAVFAIDANARARLNAVLILSVSAPSARIALAAERSAGVWSLTRRASGRRAIRSCS